MKVLNQQSTNYDIKLNRSVEINEKLKNALKSIQIEQKVCYNNVRILYNENVYYTIVHIICFIGIKKSN